jgi:ribosomal protein S7
MSQRENRQCPDEEIPKRDVPPDPLYQSPLVTKFISCVMHDGKRNAERIL